jgi:hypothetical protein
VGAGEGGEPVALSSLISPLGPHPPSPPPCCSKSHTAWVPDAGGVRVWWAGRTAGRRAGLGLPHTLPHPAPFPPPADSGRQGVCLGVLLFPLGWAAAAAQSISNKGSINRHHDEAESAALSFSPFPHPQFCNAQTRSSHTQPLNSQSSREGGTTDNRGDQGVALQALRLLPHSWHPIIP